MLPQCKRPLRSESEYRNAFTIHYDCRRMDLKRAPSSLWYTPILVGVLLLAGPDAVAQNSCVTAQCHATLLTPENVHPPAESCDSCHESIEAQHPQKGNKTFKLVSEPPGLCTTCHDDITNFPHMHGPVSAGDCTACHTPHASDIKPLLLKKDDQLCAECHVEIQELLKKPDVHPVPFCPCQHR